METSEEFQVPSSWFLVSGLSSLVSALCFLCLLTSLASAQPAPDSAALPDSLRVDIEQLDREIGRNQQDLEQTRRRLAEVEGQLGELGAREQTSLAKLGSYEDRISLTRKYLRQIQDQVAARTREVAQVARQIRLTNDEIAARKQDLGRQLTSIYKYGRLFPLEAMLSTRSLPEIYRKMIYLRWLARADQKLALELTEMGRRQSQQRARLAAAQVELGRLQQEQIAQQNSLNSARAAEAALLKKVQGEKETGAALQKQLAESAGKLEAVLADLQRKRAQGEAPGPGAFQTGKGKLPWPLRGKVIAWYGSQVHPRYKTKTNNLGIDIKAEPGAVVQSVSPGKVAYADQFMGYGNLVIVDHGSGFYTLYGNLDEMGLKVGTDVAAGSRIGSAGDYLHFEVRKDGKPVNPMDWLKPAP